MRDALIVPTGTANLASVRAAIGRAGFVPRVAGDPEQIRSSTKVILPGVGHFAAAAARLEEHGWTAALREHLRQDRPLLAICLGMQLLFAGSDEAPGVTGLGRFPGTFSPFPADIRAPHVGWSAVGPNGGVVEAGYAYFAHSFRLKNPPPGVRVASAEHGSQFVAAVEEGGILACQFHPELSGTWGAALLARWLGSP